MRSLIGKGVRMVRLDPDLVAAVRGLDIDEAYLRHCVTALCGIGSSAHGFRTTGTPEDLAVAEFVAAELRAAGLTDVAVEPVDVDGWRFHSASVVVDGVDKEPEQSLTLDAVSWGGVPGTPTDGVTGRLVDLGAATRAVLDRLDLAGAVGLLDWSGTVDPSTVVLELGRRGLLALVLNCPATGDWYQSPHALGAFDSHWPTGAPPMVLLTKEDADRLRGSAADGRTVTLTLDATLTLRTSGHNVVGYLPGEEAGPVVVGAHHDAWFQGAFDNTSGVAALLALARALTAAGHRPRHTICFTTRTAEEYGLAGSRFDWCIGAWEQVQTTHPAWQREAPFHLCLEASGHRSLRAVIEAPVELAAWARTVGRAAEAEGWTPTGWRVAPPVSGTEQWPYLVSGVPGVASYSWEKSFGRTDYHTQLDTVELLDFAYLAAQTRLHALLLLEADRDPDAVLDHRARARQLTRIAARHHHDGLTVAAARHAEAAGRAAFTAVGRAAFALDAAGAFSYPHEQSRRDVQLLDAALDALDAGRPALARRRLGRVGLNAAHRYLSEPAFGQHLQRYAPEALERSWAQASHLTASPDLWAVMASLAQDPGARPSGPWVRTAILAARSASSEELIRRLDALAHAVSRTDEVS